jgi:hypothetical protein
MLLDLMHFPEEFPKVAWGNFGEILKGNLLPSLLQKYLLSCPKT